MENAIPQDKLDELDFVPTEAELAYVDAMADNVTQSLSEKKRFNGKRNRSAWKSMNRPHLVKAQEKGAAIIHGLIDRFKVSPVKSSETQGM